MLNSFSVTWLKADDERIFDIGPGKPWFCTVSIGNYDMDQHNPPCSAGSKAWRLHELFWFLKTQKCNSFDFFCSNKSCFTHISARKSNISKEKNWKIHPEKFNLGFVCVEYTYCLPVRLLENNGHSAFFLLWLYLIFPIIHFTYRTGSLHWLWRHGHGTLPIRISLYAIQDDMIDFSQLMAQI